MRILRSGTEADDTRSVMSMHKELSVKSRVRGDFHARFCERVRVKLPRSTRPMTLCVPIPMLPASSILQNHLQMISMSADLLLGGTKTKQEQTGWILPFL